MSRFFSSKFDNLTPYVPGEQPKIHNFIKLNTNESPFPPSNTALKHAYTASSSVQLYSDPECGELTKVAAEYFNVNANELIFTNGSDEVLNFAFMAFCDKNHEAVFPDITYGFYSVFAQFNNVPYKEIPLDKNFNININDYLAINKTIFIANPNAPTGIALTVRQIEDIVKSNQNNIVVVDEAYVDFGAESCVSLIKKYNNLLVTQTFSKSRSMAGARLGVGIANSDLIADLNTIKYSTNPYNVNSITLSLGVGALTDDEYTKNNCKQIIEVRENTMHQLTEMGFTFTNSKANFIFAKHKIVSGSEIYLKLKDHGILVRHFNAPRICDYNRITVGSSEQMQKFVNTLKEILEEGK